MLSTPSFSARSFLSCLLACLLACLGLGLGTGCGSTPPEVLRPEPSAPVQPPEQAFVQEASWEEILGPGDVLRINVFDHPQLSSPPYGPGVNGTPIQGNGYIQLPLVGELLVTGLAPSEVRELVEQALAPYLKAPHVDIAVVEYASQRVFVVGAVSLPGAYPLSRPTTVLEALSFAGGFDQFANRGQVAWLRAGAENNRLVLVNAEEVDLLLAARVSPGDLIFVGRRDWADVAEATRDVLPILQGIALPLSIGFQAATLARLR